MKEMSGRSGVPAATGSLKSRRDAAPTGLAREILHRAAILAKITDVPGTITRTYRSPAMKRANAQVAIWMRAAGLTVREDPAGNLIGRRASKNPNAKTFILGSHLDTVRDAGKYDGILGVLTAIAVVKELPALPFHIEVYAFADEEGLRYSTGYLGSGAVSGLLTARDLKRKDAAGIPLGQLIRNLNACRCNPRDVLGYAEVHIEQGPVLDKRRLAVGVVKAIAGQTRAVVTFTGQAGHAGTIPMKMRRDALCAAAGFIFVSETIARKEPGLVATVGTVTVLPGAANVIPGEVVCSLDVRHADDRIRRRAVAEMLGVAQIFGKQRRVLVRWEKTADVSAVTCDAGLTRALKKSTRKYQRVVPEVVSGAGHDAVALAAITPVAMLFVRCRDGVSHNPAESVRVQDVAVAIATLKDFLLQILVRR
ncbi:MAG: allantoate amidohydrolase [Verrucomicrobiota bacterium]